MNGLANDSYRVQFVRHLGAGGIGTVDDVMVTESFGYPYVGTHLARKQLNARWRSHPEMQERFEREIELLGYMNHRNIVRLEGVSMSPGGRFYLMPLYTHSLRSVLMIHNHARSPSAVARFGAMLASAMQYAHGMGFIHRDLKPENILIRGDEVVIADWGVGQFIHRESKVLDLTVGGLGTQYYCSAEQWSTGRCDARGDIYSLGVLLAETVAGRATPISPVGAGLRVDVAPSNTRAGQMLNGILRQMTAPVPSMRQASMADVAEALMQVD